MRLRIFTSVAVILMLGAVATPLAMAADGDGGAASVSAVVPGGTRAVTVSAAVALAGTRPTLTGAYALTVTETGRNGTNPWSVTGTLSSLSSGGSSIPSSAATMSARDVVPAYTIGTPQGTKDASITGSVSMNATQTLFRINGEDANVSYTATFAATGSLSVAVPDSAPSGTYSGTLTYTLVQ